ncbi:MAG: 4Fe-4S binding protein [Christensenellales bacterium]|jgi:2-oxoglutarate ferredoxin oxidoreductase subunit delta
MAGVTIDIHRCKGCGLCVDVCPRGVLALDTKEINQKGYNPSSVVAPENCIGCSQCALMCPDVCITVER